MSISWGTAKRVSYWVSLPTICSQTVAGRGLESSIGLFQDIWAQRWEGLLLGPWTFRIIGRLWLEEAGSAYGVLSGFLKVQMGVPAAGFLYQQDCQWTAAGMCRSPVTGSFQNLQSDLTRFGGPTSRGFQPVLRWAGAGSWATSECRAGAEIYMAII